MGLFSKILNKLGLKKPEDAAASTAATSKPAAPAQRPAVAKRPVLSKVPGKDIQSKISEKAAAMPMVDVMSKLENMAGNSGLDWKVSIVDLLKVLEIESSLEARKELATELGDAVKICKVNVDNNKEIAGKYEIRAIPTILIFTEGTLTDTVVGLTSKDDLKAKVA